MPSPASSSRSAGQAFGRVRYRVLRWFLGGVLVAGALALAGAAAWPHLDAWQAWNQAQKALAADDLAQAREHLQRARARWPGSASLRFLLARTLRRQGDLVQAREELEQAARLGHSREEIDLEKVLALAQVGELETVEETLHALLEAGHAQSPLLYEALVAGYLALHDLRNAERWASRWLQEHPAAWRAYRLRGLAREQGVQLHAAAQDYRQALDLRPGDPELTFRVGEMLRRMDNFAEALPYLEAAAAAEPHDASRILALTRCLRSLGRTQEAWQRLSQWQAEHPDASAAVLALLGRLALDLQQSDQALHWLRQAEQRLPADEETFHALSVLLRDLGRPEEAERYEARAKDVRRKLKRIDGLLRVLRDQPRDVALRHELGRLLVTLGFDEAAERWLLSALELDPDHRPTHATLAELYDTRGDRESARNHRLAAQGKAKARVHR